MLASRSVGLVAVSLAVAAAPPLQRAALAQDAASLEASAIAPARELDGDDAPREVGAKTKKAGRAGKGTPDVLRFGGRVYVRDTLAGVEIPGDTIWLEERTIEDARVFFSFRPNRRTRVDLEVDFSGDKAKLKDTFIRYQPIDLLAVTAGRFKRPVSFIGLESTWQLPRIDRGLLSELRIDDRRLMFAGGRGDGVALELELPGTLRPALTFAMHQSELANDVGLEVTDVNQDLFARAEIEPVPGLHLAVAGGWVGTLARRGMRDTYRHRPFGTLEGFLETEPVRVWIEAMAGLNATTYVGTVQTGRFAAARALVAPRLERVGPLRTLEPYAAFSWYEPSMLQAGDQLTELTGGVALWISSKLRLQLEGGRRMAQGPTAASADATIVRVQLGGAFKSQMELN